MEITEEKKPAERVLAVIDSEPWLITQAGLAKIREIASRENFEISTDDLSKIEERREALAAKKAERMLGTEAVQKRDRVAIIDINGPIFRYADMFTSISGGTTVESLATDFNLAMADNSVDAVLFNIDSPGGQAKGVNELANMIASRRSEKPIGGYIGGDGGSAAMWLAGAVEPGLLGIDATGFAGSVGAVVAIRKDKPSEKDRSVTFEFVSKQSPNKRLDPETEAGKTEMQRRADALGGIFVDSLAALRGVTPDKVLSDFGGGRMLMGQEAVTAGLVDEVTSMEAMVQKLKNRRQQKTYGSPRMAATKAKEKVMFSAEFKQSLGLPETATDAEVQKKVDDLKAAAARTVAAEKESRRTIANSQVDSWEREGKISGNATAKIRVVHVAASTGEPVTPEMIAEMVAALPAIDTKRIAKEALKTDIKASAGDVTLEDFSKAHVNADCSKRIAAAVAARRKDNPKFSREDLRRELLGN